jgi:FdhD protein
LLKCGITMAKLFSSNDYIIGPDPDNSYLSSSVMGLDENGNESELNVIEERPLTIYLNSQEIVTAMTIGDHPKYLAIGFLYNQKMLKNDDEITTSKKN